ncbi:uncharacterized protein LOC118560379 [Fundulus heteroclitus]|uniref:uncharacterized protein LOC118560379 n=1 Tax=Fundulus heteroclitus TaxID=8078 RepID=UPI00165B3562|nr:uncharacterized protein LOC118560379 [Fundulus heteroclitus]
MNASTSSKAPRVPVITVDMITPTIQDFILSISLKQSMDLTSGQLDGDTKSKVKELLLKLEEKCTAFVLRKIYKGRLRSLDVETVVGDSVLRSFADVLWVEGTTPPKNFDKFNKSFVKHVKGKVRSSLCCMNDPAASFVLQISEKDTVDSMVPLAVTLIKELLEMKNEERQQRLLRKAAEGQQNALKEQQTGELHHHGRYQVLPTIPEEPELEEAAAEMNEEKESELKMVDEFICEELSEMNEEKESELKMVDEFISENGGLKDRVATATAKQQNRGVGVRIQRFLQKYSERRYKRVSPELLAVKEELRKQETDVTEVQKSVSEEQIHQVMNRKEREVKPAPEATTQVDEPLPMDSGSEKEEQQSFISLLVHALVIQAVTKSKMRCKYTKFQEITKRLSEKLCAEVEGGEFKKNQSSLNKLSADILRASCKKTGCSHINLLSILGHKDSNVEEAVLSVCKEKILKTAKEPILKRFFFSVGKALCKPFKKA